VILVGLTGGIGAGKSTVSAMLAERGAVVVDADAIVRELQAPGGAVVERVAERFGRDVVATDGSLDRAALAAIVFHDEQALKDLNAIVHPAVRDEMARRVEAERATDHVVVLDIPLLTENPRKDLAAVIVVDVPVDVAVERLVSSRGMDEADARARIANQASREDRLALATHVIDNTGQFDELRRRVDEVWSELVKLPHTPTPAPERA
jgi:dephospho-CoA kinase